MFNVLHENFWLYRESCKYRQSVRVDRFISSIRELTILFHGLIHFSCYFCAAIVHRATTHTDLVVRAKKLGVDVKVVHNASVMNAIGVCGLQLYRYGETVSLPFFTDTWRPDSFYEKIQRNRKLGLHTLCLLGKVDIFD